VVNQTVVLLMICVQVQFFATQESGRSFYYFVAKNCVNSIASNRDTGNFWGAGGFHANNFSSLNRKKVGLETPLRLAR
jgi:hypothetical protein